MSQPSRNGKLKSLLIHECKHQHLPGFVMHGNARDHTIGVEFRRQVFTFLNLFDRCAFGKLHRFLRIIHRAENCRLTKIRQSSKRIEAELKRKFTFLEMRELSYSFERDCSFPRSYLAKRMQIGEGTLTIEPR